MNRYTKRFGYLLFFFMLIVSGVYSQEATMNVFCIGDSITYGQTYGSGHDYPRLLQQMFRDRGIENIRVFNYGVSGDTVGDRLSYWQGRTGERVLQRTDAHFVTIMLGTNDTRVGDETPLDVYLERMNALIDVFANHTYSDGTIPQIILSLIPPHNSPQEDEHMASNFSTRFIHRDRIPNEMNPALRQIAEERGLLIADNYTPLKAEGPDLLPDGLHPGEKGDQLMAQTFFEVLLPLIAEPAGIREFSYKVYK